jgi:hypothetical protein
VIHNDVANFDIEVRVIERLVFIVLRKINMISQEALIKCCKKR